MSVHSTDMHLPYSKQANHLICYARKEELMVIIIKHFICIALF